MRTRRFEKLRSCESGCSKFFEVFDAEDAVQTRVAMAPPVPGPTCYLRHKLIGSAFAGLAHSAYLQILNSDHSVVFADRRCGFVQEIFARVSDTGVDFLKPPFCFLPVFAELDFATHLALLAAQPGLMFFETAKRRNEAAVTQSGEANNTHVNTHVDTNGAGPRVGCRWHGLLYFALSLSG